MDTFGKKSVENVIIDVLEEIPNHSGEIIAPLPDTVVTEPTITLEAYIQDQEEESNELTVVWTSSLDGIISEKTKVLPQVGSGLVLDATKQWSTYFDLRSYGSTGRIMFSSANEISVGTPPVQLFEPIDSSIFQHKN